MKKIWIKIIRWLRGEPKAQPILRSKLYQEAINEFKYSVYIRDFYGQRIISRRHIHEFALASHCHGLYLDGEKEGWIEYRDFMIETHGEEYTKRIEWGDNLERQGKWLTFKWSPKSSTGNWAVDKAPSDLPDKY